MKKITVEQYAEAVQEAARKYPGAKIESVGFGIKNRCWVYFLVMKKGNVEINVTIPVENFGGEENEEC